MSIREFLNGNVETAATVKDNFRIEKLKGGRGDYAKGLLIFYKKKTPIVYFPLLKELSFPNSEKLISNKVTSLKKAKEIIIEFFANKEKEKEANKPKFTTKEALNILLNGLGASEGKLGKLNFDQQDAYKILKTALKIK